MVTLPDLFPLRHTFAESVKLTGLQGDHLPCPWELPSRLFVYPLRINDWNQASLFLAGFGIKIQTPSVYVVEVASPTGWEGCQDEDEKRAKKPAVNVHLFTLCVTGFIIGIHRGRVHV